MRGKKAPRPAIFLHMKFVFVFAVFALLAAPAGAQCAGDCTGDGRVAVSELIVGVGIAAGTTQLDQCPAFDTNGSGAVEVAELIAAVNDALDGCGPPTSVTPGGSGTPTPTATPAATSTPAPGPQILFFGVTTADDRIQQPSGTTTGNPPVPIYERQFGFGFRLVIEAARGTSNSPPGDSTFAEGELPDLQVQVTRPLGNGSPVVCDVNAPNFGGVPGIDPPRFDDSPMVVDALNDLGCRFVDGAGVPVARGCNTSCIRFEDGEYACRFPQDTEAQYCAPIDAPLEFPVGDTLVTARIRDRSGILGPPAQILMRVAAP